MLKTCLLPCLLLLSAGLYGQGTERFHDFWGITIHGDTLHFSAFDGKKVLVVNTASYCAYTPQFADLAMLDSLYGGPEFAIIGFPCNDFGSQDPYSDSVINNFCTGNYNVKFQMMSKVAIVSTDTADVYKWLQQQSRNGVATVHVDWNFNKFLIDKRGRWVRHYTSTINPLDTAITNWIQEPDPVGVKTVNAKHEMKVWPSPVTTQVSVSGGPDTKIDQLLLTDMLGQTLMQARAETLDMSGFATGTYVLHIYTTDGQRHASKVMKQ